MIRILIGDDHPMIRQGTRQSLEAHTDLEIIGEAVDGEETLRLVRTLRPDILLLDISMPRLNGIEVTRVIRDEFPTLHIVIMTGYEENDHYNEALACLGVKGYLSKRATPLELAGALRQIHAGRTYFQGAFGELAARPTAPKQPTAREVDVLHLVAEGCSNQEIARQLHLTEPTVRFHVHNLFTKLGVTRRTQLVSVARQRGLL